MGLSNFFLYFVVSMRTVKFAVVLTLALGLANAHAQILPSFGNSRTGGTGMQFLKIAPDARSASMGTATVAIADDVSSMYWNPAGITNVDTGRVNVQLSHTRYFGDISSSFGGAAVKVGSLSYLGIQVMAMSYGEMDETTEFDPKGTGRKFTPVNYVAGLTYARILTSNFSFGLNGKFAQEGIAGVNVYNAMFDLGLKYHVGVRNTRFGVSFSNFGLNVSPEGEVRILKYTGEKTVSDFSSVSVPAVFRLGAAFDPISAGSHVLTVSGQLNHPTDNNETFGLGAEYSYMRVGYLRAGYEFGSDERYLYPSAGAGVKILRRWGGFSVDYGFIAKSNLGNIQRISLGILIR